MTLANLFRPLARRRLALRDATVIKIKMTAIAERAVRTNKVLPSCGHCGAKENWRQRLGVGWNGATRRHVPKRLN